MHGNYTVSSTSIVATAGTQVNLTTPSIILTLTAEQGYTVTHTDFSIGDVLPSEVLSAVFSQNGLVVECLVTFDNSFIMPSADVNLPIDIDGNAVKKQYSVAGTYDIASENATPTSSIDTVYSGSGEYGDKITLFTLVFTADANNVFAEDFRFTNSISNAFPDNYEVTTVKSASEITFTVKYTLTDDIVTGDKLNFRAFAEGILIPSQYYYNYVLTGAGSPNVVDEYSIDYSSSNLVLRVYGDEGARITIRVVNELTDTFLYTLEPIPVGANYIAFPIRLESVVADRNTTITLSGDINPTFSQTNPIIIHQTQGVIVTLAATPLAGYTITELDGPYSYKAQSGYVQLEDRLAQEIRASFIITADDNSILKFLRAPSWSDIQDTDPATNGGTEIDTTGGVTYSGDNTLEARINVVGRISTFGTTNLDMFLNVSNLFNVNPVANDDSISVTKGGSVIADVIANDVSSGTIIPIIKSQPTYGTVEVGLDTNNGIRYIHDGSNNYVDSFTYAANDGFIDSNVATVNVSIGIEAGDSLEVSATNGIFYIPVVVGDAGGEFTLHFDAGDIPDRVEILYEGNTVADSLFIGDDLTNANRAAAIATVEGTSQLNSYDYVGAGGDGTSYGQTAAWNLKVADNAVSYADPTDIAPTGNVRGVTSNYGGQVGVGNLVYTSPTDTTGVTGLDSADGNASMSYIKPPGGETFVVLKITGIEGTGWSIYQTSMV